MRWILAISALLLGCSDKSAPKATPAPEPRPVVEAPKPKPPEPEPPPEPTLPRNTDEQIEALEQAKAALQAGRNGDALKLYLQASQGPVSGAGISAGLAAADLMERNHRAADARPVYDRLLAGAEHIPEIHFAAARHAAGQVDFARAITHFKRAIELQPDLLPAYPLLGAVFSQSGRNDEAAETMLNYEKRLNRLLKILKDPQQNIADRLMILDLIGILEDDRSTNTLLGLLQDPAPQLRMASAGFLAEDPEPDTLIALSKAALAEHNGIARQVLTAALKRARKLVTDAPKPPPMPAPTPQ